MNENVDLVRRAYQAYTNSELATMLQFVDPDLEWTYLDPTLERPTPQVCHASPAWGSASPPPQPPRWTKETPVIS